MLLVFDLLGERKVLPTSLWSLVLLAISWNPSHADFKGCPGKDLCPAGDCLDGNKAEREELRDSIRGKLEWHSEIFWRDLENTSPPKRRYCYFRAVELLGDRDVVPFIWDSGGLKYDAPYDAPVEPGCVVVCTDHGSTDEPSDKPFEGKIKAGPRVEYTARALAWGPIDTYEKTGGTQKGILLPHKRPADRVRDKVLTSWVGLFSQTERIHLVELKSEWVENSVLGYGVSNFGPLDIKLIWSFSRNRSVDDEHGNLLTGKEPLEIPADSEEGFLVNVRLAEEDLKTTVAVERATAVILVEGKPLITVIVPTLVPDNGVIKEPLSDFWGPDY